LSKAYGSNIVLADLIFTIGRNEKVTLMGENGAGKTTLLKILCGIDRDFQGQLSIDSALRIGYFS